MRRIGVSEVMARYGVTSRQTITNYVKRGILPPPMRDMENGPRYWLEDEISSFIATQAARRGRQSDDHPEPLAA